MPDMFRLGTRTCLVPLRIARRLPGAHWNLNPSSQALHAKTAGTGLLGDAERFGTWRKLPSAQPCAQLKDLAGLGLGLGGRDSGETCGRLQVSGMWDLG